MPAVVGQLLDSHPYISPDTWANCSGIAAQAVLQRADIVAARRACRRMGSDEVVTAAELDSYRRSDRGNGLYAWLELLLLLREPQTDDAACLTQLHRATAGLPPRLYLQAQYERAALALKTRGVPARRAALAAALVPHQVEALHGMYEPVLRELADRLVRLGRRWREAGRPGPALQAHAAVVQLVADVAKESSAPELALLASEWSAIALNEIAADFGAGEASTRPGITTTTTTHPSSPVNLEEWERLADGAARLRERWHESAAVDGVSVVPYTGMTLHVLAAPQAYRGMMFAICLVCVAGGTFTLMGTIWLVTALFTWITTPPTDIRPGWRWGRRGACLASLIVCLPILLAAALLAVQTVDYSWLFSLRTLSALSLSFALGTVLVGLAARATTVLPAGLPGTQWSPRAAWLVAGLFAATIVLVALFWPAGYPVWSVPQGIRVFRVTMLLLGLESLLVLGLWGLRGVLGGVRRVFSWSISLRTYLRVASAGLVGASLLLLAALIFNAWADRRYQSAFEQAMADPLSHRLGADWYDRHFAALRDLIEMFPSLPTNG